MSAVWIGRTSLNQLYSTSLSKLKYSSIKSCYTGNFAIMTANSSHERALYYKKTPSPFYRILDKALLMRVYYITKSTEALLQDTR